MYRCVCSENAAEDLFLEAEEHCPQVRQLAGPA